MTMTNIILLALGLMALAGAATAGLLVLSFIVALIMKTF